MSWVTCEPKSTIRILSWPASRSEPAPRTSEESRMVIQTYVRPGGPPVKALDTVHHSLKRPISGRRAASGSGGPDLHYAARPQRADDSKLAGAYGGGDGSGGCDIFSTGR